ncbi:MAG TPA: M13-type metalloendopeptidase [Kofleriaceae bacterium]|jgi:putative endopeptidase
MKKLIAASLFVMACGGKSAPTTTTPAPTGGEMAVAPTPPAPTPVEEATPAPTGPVAEYAPAGKPTYGMFGFDKGGMNTKVKPGDNFYAYANGTWQTQTQIPEDKSNYGMFSVLSDQSDDRTKEIITNAKPADGADAKKIADYYKAFMDEAGIEKKGLTPIKADIAKLQGIKDQKALIAQFAWNSRHLRASPFGTIVGQDDRDPEHYIANLGQGGLGLPDRDMYDTNAEQFAPLREGYKKYIATMLGFAGIKDAKRADAVYALEEKIAAVHWTRIQQRDPVKTYNKMTLAELQALAPDIDWKAWMTGVGLAKADAINVNQPSAIAGTAKLVKSEPVAVWRDYLTVRLLTASAPYLSKQYVDAQFDMYGKTLSGTPQNKDRWKRGVDEVTGSLGESVGKLYVGKYFTPETKAQADALVHNLLTAMGARLDKLEWMSPATKAKAKEKLASYNPKIGYPKKWRDYSKLVVKANDAVGNDLRAGEFEYNRHLAHLGQPIDRDEWGMTPMTVNAYYNPGLNEIVFPAAILQPPFFDPNADAAVNYGGIGAVIGHEISHGFDDQGAQYDAKGALSDWWTKEDKEKFSAATSKLVAQYDAYCPFPAADGKPAQCVKGKLTLGENIADLAGLTVAYNAYKIALGDKQAPVLDGTTGDQRFFFGWAQVWRRIYRDQELANRLVTDPHSPSEFRAATVRNIDPFYNAFKPAPTDKLYLAPNARVRIW